MKKLILLVTLYIMPSFTLFNNGRLLINQANFARFMATMARKDILNAFGLPEHIKLSYDDMREIYRKKLVTMYHPDLEINKEFIKESTAKFQEIQQANAALKDTDSFGSANILDKPEEWQKTLSRIKNNHEHFIGLLKHKQVKEKERKEKEERDRIERERIQKEKREREAYEASQREYVESLYREAEKKKKEEAEKIRKKREEERRKEEHRKKIKIASAICIGLAVAARSAHGLFDYLKNTQEQLLDSIKNGDHKTLTLVCKNKLIDLYGYPDGDTPLILAVKQSDLEAVNILLNAGADPNILDKDRYSAIIWAVVNNQPAILQSILDCFKTSYHLVNRTDNLHNNALHIAILRECCDIVRILVEDRRIDLTLKNNDGLTPLDLAQDKPEILQIITESKAKDFVKKPKKIENQPQSKKVMPSKPKNIEGLWQKAEDDYNEENRNVRIAQMQEMQKNYVNNKLRNILESLNQDAGFMETKYSMKRNKIIKLIQQGGDANMTYSDEMENSQRSFLHYAVAYNDFDLVDILLKNGAYIDSRDKYKRTPLSYVSTVKMAKFLVGFNADIDYIDPDGLSLLNLAIRADRDPDLIWFYRDLNKKKTKENGWHTLAKNCNKFSEESLKEKVAILAKIIDKEQLSEGNETPVSIAQNQPSEKCKKLSKVLNELRLLPPGHSLIEKDEHLHQIYQHELG